MHTLSTALILLVGLVNLLPVGGILSAGRLQALYGVVLEDANLLILLRHRAVLFGIVGGLLIASAIQPSLRPAGFAAGLLSMLSFVVIAWLAESHNTELQRVVAVDLVASALLICAVALDHFAVHP